MKNKLELTIGWLYPDLMSTYGDRGNIIALTKRAEWRGIDVKVEQISIESSVLSLKSCDLIFMGGAQDTQQEIVGKDLLGKKGKILIEKIEKNIPGLFICGAYQFLGKYYLAADKKKIPGLGLFDLYTQNPGENVNRLIGNILVNPNIEEISEFVGFENHGGRTYLSDKTLALGKVIKGFGNNGKDQTEGIHYKNAFGTYLHGPILPKNPQFADYLILKALEEKYKQKFHLEPLSNEIEQKARKQVTELYFK